MGEAAMRIGYGVLVIYNHPIEKSSSYATFKDQLSILVADNSTNEEIRKRNQKQDKFCQRDFEDHFGHEAGGFFKAP